MCGVRSQLGVAMRSSVCECRVAYTLRLCIYAVPLPLALLGHAVGVLLKPAVALVWALWRRAVCVEIRLIIMCDVCERVM